MIDPPRRSNSPSTLLHDTNDRHSQRTDFREEEENGEEKDFDDDDDEVELINYSSPMRKRPPPKGGDMACASPNILRQLRQYQNIRKVGGTECVNDVYVRDPNTKGKETRFWFVGKMARCTGTVSTEEALTRQINLLQEHACRIRPVELGRSFGRLEFFVAPGDTELLTSQNDPGIGLKKVVVASDDGEAMEEKVSLLEVGLNLEIVTNRGVGFYVIRTEDGVVPPHLLG
eukprot:CAMPEP_0171349090 /NCGR_PEP_ID=MMETSP0878-20121228/32769_1 /TAXON_ID=67004 /ORGANISM="Thalassiosira weissflogii, Strain CCMP1336" /LENGTH=229 /DNA_ID=CAMNT_0011853639 /DNA_START=156 /DNA_END=845 /DNA_ORIENTATION=-